MLPFWRVDFPEMSEFRKGHLRGELGGEETSATFNTTDGIWNQRAGVVERIREKIEHSIPNEVIRRAALDFFAFAIENANEERGNAWYVREIRARTLAHDGPHACMRYRAETAGQCHRTYR